MPDGSKIRRAAGGIAAAIEGRVAGAVFFTFEWPERHEGLLSGRLVFATPVVMEPVGGRKCYRHPR